MGFSCSVRLRRFKFTELSTKGIICASALEQYREEDVRADVIQTNDLKLTGLESKKLEPVCRNGCVVRVFGNKKNINITEKAY